MMLDTCDTCKHAKSITGKHCYYIVGFCYLFSKWSPKDSEDSEITSSTDKQELKPCPFCGSTDILFKQTKGLVYSSMVCDKCNVSIPSIYQTEEEAIEIWNRRR